MIKHLASLPALALVTVLILRGLSAQPSAEQNAHATEASTATDETVSADSPYLELAREVYSESVKGAINARAIAIFNKAQTSGDAIGWTRQLCSKTAQDIATIRQRYGMATGEAQQFGWFLNRASELSACALAYHWLTNGGVASDLTSVDPTALLQSYSEVFPDGN
jgi:hypothetical protein